MPRVGKGAETKMALHGIFMAHSAVIVYGIMCTDREGPPIPWFLSCAVRWVRTSAHGAQTGYERTVSPNGTAGDLAIDVQYGVKSHSLLADQ